MSRAARDAQGKRLLPPARAAGGTSGAALNKDQLNKAGALGRVGGSWSTAADVRMLEQERSSDLAHCSLGKAVTSSRTLLAVQPLPAEMQNAASGRGVASHPVSPAVTSPGHPWRQTELSTVPRALSGHHHLHMGSSLGTGKEGSRSTCPAPRAPAASLGQPSLQSKGFPVIPDHSGVWSKQSWAVLSCSSWFGDGHGKTSTRNLLFVSSLSFPS